MPMPMWTHRLRCSKEARSPGKWWLPATYALLFPGMDKWKQTVAERLLFSYRLDDAAWTPFQSGNAAVFQKLSSGNHRFAVRAMDRSGNVERHPPSIQFRVMPPWYLSAAFLLLAAAGMAAILEPGVPRHHASTCGAAN